MRMRILKHSEVGWTEELLSAWPWTRLRGMMIELLLAPFKRHGYAFSRVFDKRFFVDSLPSLDSVSGQWDHAWIAGRI